MSRKYTRVQENEEKILKLREEGLTREEIGKRLGLSKVQIKNFINRYNHKQSKIESGVLIRKKGRPPKDYVITEAMKINELKYIIARKDSKIKALEMENELMRDFLSLTERK